MDTTTAPVACALTRRDYEARLGWIGELTRDALVGHHRRDLTLELRYRQECADRVQHMVRLEQACCAFLTFEVAAGDGHVRLTITAPERAREVADQLFQQFLSAEPGRRRGPVSVEMRH